MTHSFAKHLEPTIIWFRHDLRINEQPTFLAAIERGAPVIPIYIWSPQDEGHWPMGAASRWWLHHSLHSLQDDLAKLGLDLIIRKGPFLQTLLALVKETNAQAVFWNRCYEPARILGDTAIKSALQKEKIKAKSFNGSLLFEPWTVLNKENKPFKVFTHYWKHCLKSFEPTQIGQYPSHPLPYPNKLSTLKIDSLELLPKIHWDKGLAARWQPGEKHAQNALKKALQEAIPNYLEARDFPELDSTSRLSPYLHFGELSPHMIWHAVKAEKNLDKEEAEGYLRQICWREFAYYLLYHFPETPEKPLYPKFDKMAWKNDAKGLHAWQKGLTGYPIVDAGMRQLWATGWMHNRLRLIVGSFLVKDLLISWVEGEKWFWDTLVDADLANNTMGWQWVGGCGADAAPYFRIFNPITQGEKFDTEGEFVKTWVPELTHLPKKWIHRPWEAPEEILRQAGITLGENYPKPIVDHNTARLRALEEFANLKNYE